MPGETANSPDPIGVWDHQRAVDIVRSTEGHLDLRVEEYLENARCEIWMSIEEFPNSHLFTRIRRSSRYSAVLLGQASKS
nr:hypothetical protein CFP56_64696 [Quercus suber]